MAWEDRKLCAAQGICMVLEKGHNNIVLSFGILWVCLRMEYAVPLNTHCKWETMNNLLVGFYFQTKPMYWMYCSYYIPFPIFTDTGCCRTYPFFASCWFNNFWLPSKWGDDQNGQQKIDSHYSNLQKDRNAIYHNFSLFFTICVFAEFCWDRMKITKAPQKWSLTRCFFHSVPPATRSWRAVFTGGEVEGILSPKMIPWGIGMVTQATTYGCVER